MNKTDMQLFEVPIPVELDKYPARHRVHGVQYSRNPNALFARKWFAYAIAEWQLPGTTRWLPVRDLVCRMRLANQVNHRFPRNSERYATTW